MKDGMKNFIIVLVCVAVIVVFAIISINRKNNAEIENQRIQNIISNTNIDISIQNENTNDVINNVNYFVLYDGYEIEIKTGSQALIDMDNTDENNEKYNIKYYCYENGKISEENGKFGEETYEGVSIVQNVKRIAFSEKFDAIPRKYKTLKKLPDEFKLKLDYTNIDINEIDLDGDGKDEYIICYEIDDRKNEIAKSSIELYDSNYQKNATLMSLDDGRVSENESYFLEIDDIEYIEIDNDNVMEIIIYKPAYEGGNICIYKYVNGNLYGEINTKVSLEP